LTADEDGYVSEIIADEIGTAAMILGAGRATKESEIDLAVGLMLNKKVGDQVSKGDSLVTIYSNTENLEDVKSRIRSAYTISKDAVDTPPLIYKEIKQ
jgi:pyrimidine-nucleoside phosphorylase